MIIDIHMHLGNLLYPNGGNMIGELRKMPTRMNIQKFEERILGFRSNALIKKIFEKYDDKYTLSVQNRIKAATIGNLQIYLNKLSNYSLKYFNDDKVYCFGMPIAPNVLFEDLYYWGKQEKRLLPFTSMDPNIPINDAVKLLESSMDACYGLKLHPIIQGVPFDSERNYAILDTFKVTKKPVLFHAGASRYYIGNERHLQHCELDNPHAAKKMIERYPTIPFVVGHAGIAEYAEWAELIRHFDNVYVDITVQSISTIKNILSYYGEDRLLFASDWPAVDCDTTLKIVRKALTNCQFEKCMYKNALNLVKIEDVK